jgi:hypothetical protein
MFKNRFTLIAAILVPIFVSLAVASPFSTAPSSGDLTWPHRPVIFPQTGVSGLSDNHRRQAEIDGEEDQPYALDSATRSSIAWGEALQEAGKLGVSSTCSNTAREKIFAGIPENLDSVTRSYIAWGLALQAKDDICEL